MSIPLAWGASSITDRYIALAIQGDLGNAAALIEEAERAGDPVAAEWAPRFHRRFVESSEPPNPGSGDALLDGVVVAYRRYWAEGLLGASTVDASESRLASGLVGLSGRPGNRSETEQHLQHSLAARGIHVLFTPAPPLRDFFAWREQRRARYEVELVEGPRAVEVVFMNDFVSLGWKDYASLGLASTTGWVQDGVLWCVEWAYLPGSEAFEVSYLKHEARHLADLERFPGLTSAELEYRAKLTELAWASTTLYRLLDDFTAKSAPNPDAPHADANQRVARDIHRALFGTETLPAHADWRRASPHRINAAARELLRADTLEFARPRG